MQFGPPTFTTDGNGTNFKNTSDLENLNLFIAFMFVIAFLLFLGAISNCYNNRHYTQIL